MTEDRSLEKEHEFPTKEVKDVEKLVNEGSKQRNNRLTGWKKGNDRDKRIFSKGGRKLVIDLADKIRISIRSFDIKTSHKLRKREKAGRAVIVTFKSRKLRNNSYEPRKQRVGLIHYLCCVHYKCISQNH